MSNPLSYSAIIQFFGSLDVARSHGWLDWPNHAGMYLPRREAELAK